MSDCTRLLRQMADGDREASERLMPLVYDEMRQLAAGCFRNQPADHTLQPTALVHEAFIRMIDRSEIDYECRSHFMGVAATAMKRILIDHARRKRAAKHGGGRGTVTLHEADASDDSRDVDATALGEVLEKLTALDERKARVVELKFFGGLGNETIAGLLGVARSTVAEDWRFARAWLIRELRDHDDEPGDDRS